MAQYGPQLVLYDEHPLGVRALAKPAQTVRLLPGPEDALWALHPKDLEASGTPPLWEPSPSPRDAAGCLEDVRIAGDPKDPLAWQVAEALLPSGHATPMVPSRAGPWWVHDIWPDRGGAPRRFVAGTGEAPPRVYSYPEEPGWWPTAPPAWDPAREAVVLAHRNPARGTRVQAVNPRTGQVVAEARWPERQQWGPTLHSEGLLFFDGESVHLAPWGGGPDLASVHLPDAPDWIPPHAPEGVRLVATPEAVHVLVPHTIAPGTAGKDEPVLSWYRLAPDLTGPTPLRAWRLQIARPPEAVFIDQRVEAFARKLPGRPGELLVAVQVGWSRYELLVLDLRRPRILHRVDVAPGDELTDSGYLRTKPVVARRGDAVRVAWVDIWGVLKVADL